MMVQITMEVVVSTVSLIPASELEPLELGAYMEGDVFLFHGLLLLLC